MSLRVTMGGAGGAPAIVRREITPSPPNAVEHAA